MDVKEVVEVASLIPKLKGMLEMSGASLARTRQILSRITITPDLLGLAIKQAELEGRQKLLEEAVSKLELSLANRYRSSDLGIPILPIIAAGIGLMITSAAGSLIYFSHVKKHLEETRAYERYLECFNQMVASGSSPSEARRYCLGQYAAEGNILRYMLLAAGLFGGIYLLGKIIERR